MELRPELVPPELDEGLVARLAELADALDGASPGEWKNDLAEFNQLAETAVTIDEFQGISGAEDHEDWVRRMLYGIRIKPAANVTRDELIEVVRRAIPAETNEYFQQHEAYMAVFDANVPLDNASNLIFYPPDYDPKTGTWDKGKPISSYDPTPEQIVQWALSSSVGKSETRQIIAPSASIADNDALIVDLIRKALKNMQQGKYREARQHALDVLKLDDSHAVAKQVLSVADRAGKQNASTVPLPSIPSSSTNTPPFSPGFRFSAVDGVVLMLGAAMMIGFYWIDPWIGLAIGFVVAHFFLFCNVFRLPRLLELAWAGFFICAAFIAMAGVISWPFTFTLSLVSTVIVIGIAIRRPSYHGIAWKTFNPQLPEWWRSRWSED